MAIGTKQDQWFRIGDRVHRNDCRYIKPGTPGWAWGNENQPTRSALVTMAANPLTVDPCKVCCPGTWLALGRGEE